MPRGGLEFALKFIIFNSHFYTLKHSWSAFIEAFLRKSCRIFVGAMVSQFNHGTS